MLTAENSLALPSGRLATLRSRLSADIGATLRKLIGGRAKRHKDVARIANSEGDRLFLQVSVDDWQWTLRRPDGVEKDSNSGEGPLEAVGGFRAEEAFKTIGADLGRAGVVADGLRGIDILLEDPGIIVVDGKSGRVRHHGAPALRDLGARRLGAKAATFGQQTLWAGDEALEVFAFAGAVRISRQLGGLDALALGVTSIVPITSLLLHHAANAAAEAQSGCTIYISQFHTYVASVDRTDGIALVRVIPVGVATLATAFAAAAGQSVADARNTLGTRDMVSSLPIEKEGEVGDGLRFGVAERALLPLLGQLLRGLNETFEYLVEQRMARPPAHIDMLQPAFEVKGLYDLLRRVLDVDVRLSEQRPMDLMVTVPTERLANLLTGTEGTLVTVGKVGYTYDRQRLVRAPQLARATVRMHAKGRNTGSARDGTRKRGRSSAREPDVSTASGLLAALRQRLAADSPKLSAFLGGGASGGGAAADDDLDQRRERAGMVAFVCVVLMAMYYAYTLYDNMDAASRRVFASAQATAASNVNLRRQIAALGGADGVVSNKVLWTEKFLALGRHMSNALWLTDVFLVSQDRQVGASKITGKKMVIEGGVLPDTKGHILNIAEYIQALLNDSENFMSDFAEISFQGAHRETGKSDDIVRFRIEAIYDADKRVAVASTNDRGDGLSELDKLKAAVKERNSATESSTTIKGLK